MLTIFASLIYMNTLGNTGYRDVKRIAIKRIQNGIWAPGTLLPSETNLAQELGCTRTTVSRAMRELAEEGYLERRRKAGTRVRISPIRQTRLSIPLIQKEIQASGASYRYVLVLREACLAPDWLSAQLGLAKGTSTLHLVCMHYANNQSFALEDRWINLSSVPNAAKESFEKIGPNEWLVNQVPYSRAEFGFTAAIADAKLARFLAAREGDAIILADRTTWLDEEPVTYALFSYAPGYKIRTDS